MGHKNKITAKQAKEISNGYWQSLAMLNFAYLSIKAAAWSGDYFVNLESEGWQHGFLTSDAALQNLLDDGFKVEFSRRESTSGPLLQGYTEISWKP